MRGSELSMKKLFAIMFLITVVAAISFSQQKYALVIGNANYTSIRKLVNPVNDATAIAAKLRSLGYQVELQTNIGNAAMGRSVNTFIQRLSGSRDNEGFFWFAGHGVQLDGENFLLPVDVDGTDDVSVKYSSFPVNRLIESFDKTARNKVNVVVLDACRNNPFTKAGGKRSLSRGLSVVHDIPPDLFIIFSTAANDEADDGEGKNHSPFADAFLRNMDSNEDLSIVIRSITRETLQLTNNKQRPYHDGSIISLDYYSLNPRKGGQPAPANMVRVEGGTFQMGGTGYYDDEKPVHTVTVKSFSMGKYEVTQKEYQEVMGTNLSSFKGDNLPVEQVSWYDAIEYCNARSRKEGLTPAYTIDKSRSDPNNTNKYDDVRWVVMWNRNANGYRLPTEAEWEYACRAGTRTPFSTGNNITTSMANYNGKDSPFDSNAKGINREKTTMVGSFAPNPWGLYDMHGNVQEWCWDWYGDYSSEAQTNPVGASSGSYRMKRGGYWDDAAANARSVSRSSNDPNLRHNGLGFRVARNGE